jgi:hypothetical protein
MERRELRQTVDDNQSGKEDSCEIGTHGGRDDGYTDDRDVAKLSMLNGAPATERKGCLTSIN